MFCTHTLFKSLECERPFQIIPLGEFMGEALLHCRFPTTIDGIKPERLIIEYQTEGRTSRVGWPSEVYD